MQCMFWYITNIYFALVPWSCEVNEPYLRDTSTDSGKSETQASL